MAAIRQGNWLGQARIDVRDMRAIESAMAADWDIFAGQMVAGERPSVLYGMSVLTTGALQVPATNLRVNVADALLLHFGATDSGTLYKAPTDRVPEVLSPSNTRVSGSWSAGVTNYVGIELIRTADATTADTSKFYVPDTDSEVGKTVPLGRTLDYKFTISPLPFSAQSTILPIAKVVLDTSSNVTGIVDAREMLFRLGRGGDQPNQSPYPWPQSRVEAYGGDIFAGGDKGLTSVKDWMDAAMTRIWEIGGGPAWYSPTADRNVTMVWTGATFTNGENFEWDGTNLHWKGLKFLFDNTAGVYNDVADQTVNGAQTALADGDCLYVDVDRTVNRTGGTALDANKAALATLGTGTVPGGRTILAWRVGANIFTRNWRYPVGMTFTPATTTSLGVVKLNQTPGSVPLPVVVSIMADGRIEVAATANDARAITGRGFGNGAGVVGYGGVHHGAFSLDNAGLLGYGSNGWAGTITEQHGHPGSTAYGGTGGVGGVGGYSFGGAGDVILNANAIGGAGHWFQGGAGRGTGLGGYGAGGLGGVGGTGTIREPSFVAPVPNSGPTQTVAFKSEAGSFELVANATDTYRFTTAKTGSLMVPAVEFQVRQEATKTALFDSPVSTGATVVPAWVARNANSGNLSATIRLPRGATITACHLNVHNTDGVARDILVYMEETVFKGTGAPTANTTIYNGASVACTNGVNGWFSCGAPTPVAVMPGSALASDSSSYIWVSVAIPTLTNDQALLFKGLIVEYTYRTVDFMV